MLKYVFTFIFGLSICLNVYLLNSEVLVTNSLESPLSHTGFADKVSISSSALDKSTQKINAEDAQQVLIEKSAEKMNSKKPSDTENLEAQFDYEEAKKNRSASVKKFFYHSNYNLISQFEDYQKLSEEYEDALSAIYNNKKPYIDSEGRTIFWNELEDDIRRGEITAKYLQKLKAQLGAEGYEEFQAFKDMHNRKAFQANKFGNLITF